MSSDALRSIRHSAQRMVELIQQRYPHIQAQKQLAANMDASIPLLHLPYPSDIIALICTLALPKQTTSKLCERISHWHQTLNSQLSFKFEQSCRELLPKLSSDKAMHCMNALLRTYQTSYSEHYIPLVKADILAMMSRRSEPVERDKRTRFNSQHVPLLEKYFQRNAYPSARHRAALAFQTKMTLRQIEVWFQNHRNRSKKDGKPLKRLALDTMSVEAVIGDPLPSPSEEETSSDEFSDEDCVPQTEKPVYPSFSTSAPTHAFPTSYPPNCFVDPFPRINGSFEFPLPTWPRKPVTVPVKHSDISPDDLAALFSTKLTLRGVREADSRKSGGTKRPWHWSRTTVLPSAPHPALVRLPSGSCTWSSKPTDQMLGFQQLKPHRLPAASLSSRPSPKPRKQYPFPLRLPRSMGPFDAYSRASSFTSINSSNSRLVSTSSQSSIEPTTPPLSPTVLHIEPNIAEQSFSDFPELLIPDTEQFFKDLPSQTFNFPNGQLFSSFIFPSYGLEGLVVP